MNPQQVSRILDRANELLESGKPAESLRCLRRLVQARLDDEDRIEFVSLSAWALSELNRYSEALELLSGAIDEFPDSARLRGTRGVVLSNAGDFEQACSELEEACRIDGEDEVAVANLALVYERLREYDRALELYERAIELGADIDWLLQRKAAVQNELGELKAAKSSLSRYLSLEPDDAEQWVNLGVLHSDEREYPQAFACYRSAEQIAPDSISLRLNWGVTAVRAGDLDLARQQLRYLERLEGERSRVLLLRAFILEEEGAVAEATRAYEQALDRVSADNEDEAAYALEMSMDFASRHEQVAWCETLLDRAYQQNVCTVELCEAHREATGEYLEQGVWFSMLIEGAYRSGLVEVPDLDRQTRPPFTRFLRNFQVIARDRDEAVALALELCERMNEKDARIREIVSEEPIDDTYTGLYEIDRQSLVFNDEDA